MAINIKYENNFEMPITSQQMQNTDNFYKVYIDNDLIIKKEEFENNTLIKLIYYRGSTESEQQAITNILNHYDSLKEGFEIRTVEIINNHKKETHRFFSSTGSYDNFFVTQLYNQYNLLVYEKEENEFNGIINTDIRKYYLDQSNDQQYEFLYDTNGQLLAMKGENPPFVPENDYTISAVEINLFFPNFLVANPYYNNAELLPT